MNRILWVLAVVLFLFTSQALAFGGECGMGPGMNSYIFSALDLTDDQRQQFQSRQEAFVAEISPLRNELFTKREELRQLWAKGDPDHEGILAKQQEILQIQGRIQEKAAEYRIECRQALSPEQQAKLTNLTAQHGGWRRGRELTGQSE